MAHKIKRRGFKTPNLDIELPLEDSDTEEFTGESPVQTVLFCNSSSKLFFIYLFSFRFRRWIVYFNLVTMFQSQIVKSLVCEHRVNVLELIS